ncbi:MAG: dihydrolipoyl dehydrogenase [Bacteroidetes bacterium]|jgi:dihydrolipoamide dehydrogenase|nr:dihydrolipoyl dehydrogenase [Bacteroidota bacterium]
MYDLGIIGAGPAGYVAAERAGQNGLKVVLFEKKELGGVCLNEGCIPTKSLLYAAKIYEAAINGKKYGVLTTDASVDFKGMMKRKNATVKKLVGGVGSKMKHHKVEVVKGSATIHSKSNTHINIACNDQHYPCENILICTGSYAFLPPVEGLGPDTVMTNREILEITTAPEKLTIIGGGVIGSEFASFFNSIGTEVTVIEMMDEILSGMDLEISAVARKELDRRGITFHLRSRVTGVNGKKVQFEKEGETHESDGNAILCCVGRKPIVEGLGLEKLGVELFKGGVKIDEKCRTNIPNVYAAGDVTGFSLLAHTASREGEVVVNHILGKKDNMRYKAIPNVVYCNPEIAGVGYTEDEAKKYNIEFEVRKLPMTYAGRFIAENDSFSGICKILTGKKYNEIIGVHIVGNPASELIYGAAMAIEQEMTLEEMQEVVFPHPTVSEIFKETVFTSNI